MLNIHVPPTGSTPLTFDDFKNFELPVPSKGIDETENETVLIFNDENEAVNYADQLEEISTNVSNHTHEKDVVRDVVTAIRNDETVRNFLE